MAINENDPNNVNQASTLGTNAAILPAYQQNQSHLDQKNKNLINDDDLKAPLLPQFLLQVNPVVPMILPVLDEGNSNDVLTQVSDHINRTPHHRIEFPKTQAGVFTKPDFLIDIQTSNPPGQSGINISVQKTNEKAGPLPTAEAWVNHFNSVESKDLLSKKLQSISGTPNEVIAKINKDGDVEFFAKNGGIERGLTENESAALANVVVTLMQTDIPNACVYQHKAGEAQDIVALMNEASTLTQGYAQENKENVQPNVNVGDRIADINDLKFRLSDTSKTTLNVIYDGAKFEYQIKKLDKDGKPEYKTLSENSPEDLEHLNKAKALVSQVVNLDSATYSLFKSGTEKGSIDNALTWTQSRSKAEVLKTTFEEKVAIKHDSLTGKIDQSIPSGNSNNKQSFN